MAKRQPKKPVTRAEFNRTIDELWELDRQHPFLGQTIEAPEAGDDRHDSTAPPPTLRPRPRR